MASAEVIEEISQFYDIKQIVNTGGTLYYITHRNIKIFIGTKYTDGLYYNNYAYNRDIITLKVNINRIILLIDKLNEMFECTFEVGLDNYGAIRVGNIKIYYQYRNCICVNKLLFYKEYYNVCDVIEYLKKSCPECIKLGDIKIALKD